RSIRSQVHRLRSRFYQELHCSLRGGGCQAAVEGVRSRFRQYESGGAAARGRGARPPHPSRRTSDLALANVERRDRDGFLRQPQAEQEACDRSYRRRGGHADGTRGRRAAAATARHRGAHSLEAESMSCWPYTTRRWERLRFVKLATNPCCEACLQVGE